MADLLLAAETDRVFADGGHSLDFINKAFECLDLIGWRHAAELVPIVIGGGALDFGLAMTDLVAGARREWLPRGYGVAETAVGGAQFAICLELASSTRPSNVGHGLWAYGAVFGAILTTHGLVTLLAPRSHTEAPAPTAPVVIAPLALSDVARAAVPGMAVLGRF